MSWRDEDSTMEVGYSPRHRIVKKERVESTIDRIVLPYVDYQMQHEAINEFGHPYKFFPKELKDDGKEVVYIGMSNIEMVDLFLNVKTKKLYGSGFAAIQYSTPNAEPCVAGSDIHFSSVYELEKDVYVVNYMVVMGSNYHYRSVLIVQEEKTKLEQKVRNAVNELVDRYAVFLQEYKKYEQKTDLSLFDRVFLKGDLKDEILTDFQRFMTSKKEYKELQLPWKRGYIFSGPPGNGKTLMLRSLREAFKLSFTDLTTVINSRTGKLEIDRAEESSRFSPTCPLEIEKLARQKFDVDVPTIYYLEDMDKVVGRNDKDFSEVSLTNLLNGIDGVEQVADGFVLIATTNFLEDMVEAVVGRPGRFDRVWDFEKPEVDQIKEFFDYYSFVVRYGNGELVTDIIIGELHGFSMAFVEEFIKSAKMKTKSNEIDYDDAREILKNINDHNRKYKQMGGKLGF